MDWQKRLLELEKELCKLTQDGSFLFYFPRDTPTSVIVTSSHGISQNEIVREINIAQLTLSVAVESNSIGIIGTYSKDYKNLDEIDESNLCGYHHAIEKSIEALKNYYDEIAIISLHGFDEKKERPRIKVKKEGKEYLTNLKGKDIDIGIGNYPPRVSPPKKECLRKIWFKDVTMKPAYAEKVAEEFRKNELVAEVGQYFRSEFTFNVTRWKGNPGKGIHACNIEYSKECRTEKYVLTKKATVEVVKLLHKLLTKEI